MNIEDIIRYEVESTSVDFKVSQYTKQQYISFIKDVLAMANARTSESRYIIIGVQEKAGVKTLVGLKEPMVDAATFQQIIHDNIEPDVNISYTPFEMDEMTFGIFEISGCNNQPYMMKKDYVIPNNRDSLKKGDCFIRKGTTQMKAGRGDLDLMYEKRTTSPYFNEELEIVFSSSDTSEMVMAVPRNYLPPSVIEAYRDRKIYDQYSLNLKSIIDQLNPSAASDAEHTALSEQEILAQMAAAEFPCSEADLNYFIGTYGTAINFWVHNKGSKYIEDASVRIYVPRIRGLKVVHKFKPGSSMEQLFSPRNSYAEVTELDEQYVINYEIGVIKHHVTCSMFDKAPVIAARETLDGQVIPIKMMITAKNLKNPIYREFAIKVQIHKKGKLTQL